MLLILRSIKETIRVNVSLEIRLKPGVNPEEMRIAPSVQSLQVKKNDSFLICSDGVTDMVAREDLVAMMSEEIRPGESVQLIIDAALDAGGRDNITAIVIRAT